MKDITSSGSTAEKHFGQNPVFRLTIPIVFPAGISACSGAVGNLISLARNGKEQVVLRGSSIAGVLRDLWRKENKAEDADAVVTDIFGSPAGEKSFRESPLIVPDLVLETGQSVSVERMCHCRNRHTGSVLDGGLFEIEATPPGTSAELTLWLESEKESAMKFMRTVLRHLREGMIFGGHSNRGVGLALIHENPDHRGRPRPCGYRMYQLDKPDDLMAYLDDHRLWREGKRFADYKTLPEGAKYESDSLKVEFTLSIPPGQDILIAEGAEIEPRQVTRADGQKFFVLPGSTLRGLFRGWCIRLAAREGKKISDDASQYRARMEAKKYTGEQIGSLFQKDQDVPSPTEEYPIESMFGSLYRKGRLHISDALSLNSVPDNTSLRKHVAVDPISGGAIEGLLFENRVLTKGAFAATLLLKRPQEDEVRWLAMTLKALNQGLLRVGSSKASGRMVVDGEPTAMGEKSDLFLDMYRDSPIEIEESSTDSSSANSIQGTLWQTPGGRGWQCLCGNKRPISIPESINKSWFRQKHPVVITLDDFGAVIAVEKSTPPSQSVQPTQSTQSVSTLDRRSSQTAIPSNGFHNPYQFIKFTETKPDRRLHDLQTADEQDPEERFTGIFELKVTTRSPLLASDPESENVTASEHKKYQALTIDNDVIVPATGVRGALRNLFRIITGGPLTTEGRAGISKDKNGGGVDICRMLEDDPRDLSYLQPDYLQEDGNVSEVTNLFGMVPVQSGSAKTTAQSAFSGRIRADNLVFRDGKGCLTRQTPLAILASPHPDNDELYYTPSTFCAQSRLRPLDGAHAGDELQSQSHVGLVYTKTRQLRGYKVYRCAKPGEKPWERSGNECDSQNISAQLLPKDRTGELLLSVRSLSVREMSILRLLCGQFPWRIGGGKSLGLGWCEIKIVSIRDEFGRTLTDNELRRWEIDPKDWLWERCDWYKKSQVPVKNLRYQQRDRRNSFPEFDPQNPDGDWLTPKKM